MASGPATPPRDPDILIGMIDEFRDENDKLRSVAETLKRMLIGARSERRDADLAQLGPGLGYVTSIPVTLDPEPNIKTNDDATR